MSYPVKLYIDNKVVSNIEKLVSTTDEHGDEQVTFQFKTAASLPKARVDVSLFDPTYGYYWHGYIADVTPAWMGCPKVTAKGIWRTANSVPWYENKIWLAGTPMATMISDALAKCERISGTTANLATQFQTQLAEDSPSVGLQGPEDAFNYFQQLTDYLSTPIVWQVRQNPAVPFTPSALLDLKFLDPAPRYRLRLGKNDKFEPHYDSDILYNAGAVRWGNQQYQLATDTGFSQPNIPGNPPPVMPVVSHKVIPDTRVKRIDAQSTINDITEIQQLARWLATRNGQLRPAQTPLTIDCNTIITSVTPAIISNNLPHHLVRSNFALRILNIPQEWAPYNIDTFYVINTSYDYDSEVLTLTMGDPVLKDAIRLMGNYDTSREYISIKSGVINLVRRDADVLSQYGPEYTGKSLVPNPDDSTILNNPSAGIPQFISSVSSSNRSPKFDDKNKTFYQPEGQSIDPTLLPDYGTKANFAREADSPGIKGFVEVIPQIVLTWRIAFLPPANSDTIPSNSIEVEFYSTYPFTPGAPFATKSITSAQENSGNFLNTTERHIFTQNGRIGVRVKTAASQPGIGFSVAIGGRKLFPDLGVNS